MTDEIETTGDDTRDTRRDALKKIGVGAAVAWSVPVIASSPALAGGSDAPFPPNRCPACSPSAPLVLNGQANVSVGNVPPTSWSGTGTGSTYPAILFGVGGSLSCDTNAAAFLVDPSEFLQQDVALSGFCAEQPFTVTACGTQVGTAGTPAQLSVTLLRNGNPVAGGGTDPLVGSNSTPLPTESLSVAGVLPPVVDPNVDVLTVRIRLEGSSESGQPAYFDGITLVLNCV